MTTQVQKFADQVVAAAKRAVTSMQVPTVVWGTVTAIGSGTVSFAPQGSPSHSLASATWTATPQRSGTRWSRTRSGRTFSSSARDTRRMEP